MTSAELRLTYHPDDEWNGQLAAAVTSGSFSGRGAAWFCRQQLCETFVAALRKYPLQQDDLPQMEGGFYSQERPGTLEQCHLRVTVEPYDLRGRLLVLVDLATEVWPTGMKGRAQMVQVSFFSEYLALDKFANDVQRLLEDEKGEAVLRGMAPR